MISMLGFSNLSPPVVRKETSTVTKVDQTTVMAHDENQLEMWIYSPLLTTGDV